MGPGVRWDDGEFHDLRGQGRPDSGDDKLNVFLRHPDPDGQPDQSVGDFPGDRKITHGATESESGR